MFTRLFNCKALSNHNLRSRGCCHKRPAHVKKKKKKSLTNFQGRRRVGPIPVFFIIQENKKGFGRSQTSLCNKGVFFLHSLNFMTNYGWDCHTFWMSWILFLKCTFLRTMERYFNCYYNNNLKPLWYIEYWVTMQSPGDLVKVRPKVFFYRKLDKIML